MAKKSFLKTKGALKALPGKAVNAGMRIGGAAGAGYLSNKVIGTKINPKFHGLIFLGVGLLGETLIEDPKLNSLAQGVTVYGGLQVLAKNVLPNQAANFGLSGDDDFSDFEQIEGLDDTPAEYYEEAEALEGIDEAMELLSGDSMGDVYTPEEMELAASLSGQ